MTNKLTDQNSNFFILKKFKTRLLKEGKQTKAHKIMTEVCFNLKKINSDPFTLLKEAVDNVKPFFIIKTIRKGKRNIIQPLPITNENTRKSLAIKTIIKNAKKNKGYSFTEQLIKEITDASCNEGFSKQEQQATHTIILNNRKQIQVSQSKNFLNF